MVDEKILDKYQNISEITFTFSNRVDKNGNEKVELFLKTYNLLTKEEKEYKEKFLVGEYKLPLLEKLFNEYINSSRIVSSSILTTGLKRKNREIFKIVNENNITFNIISNNVLKSAPDIFEKTEKKRVKDFTSIFDELIANDKLGDLFLYSLNSKYSSLSFNNIDNKQNIRYCIRTEKRHGREEFCKEDLQICQNIVSFLISKNNKIEAQNLNNQVNNANINDNNVLIQKLIRRMVK